MSITISHTTSDVELILECVALQVLPLPQFYLTCYNYQRSYQLHPDQQI